MARTTTCAESQAKEIARVRQQLLETQRELAESREQQMATAEVLRVIAASSTNLQQVLAAVAANSRRLIAADSISIFGREDLAMRRLAVSGSHLGDLPVGEVLPVPGAYSTVLSGQTVHVPNTLAEGIAGAYPYIAAQNEEARRRGRPIYRVFLSVPLSQNGATVGSINATRLEPRPFAHQEIRLLETFADQAVIAIENARLFSELRERDERRRQELERASLIQQRLLPGHIEGWPGVLELAVRFRPAVETAGDFYDVVALTPAAGEALPPLQIAVGDVAGKGMAAALVTALARAALRATTGVPTELATPANVLRLTGRRLHQDVGRQHFVACALAVIEPPNAERRHPWLRLGNAGQAPVLLCRAGQVQELEPTGTRLPLGVLADAVYKDTETTLQPGDVVVFSSDGLAEAPAQSKVTLPTDSPFPPPQQPGELFGFERLAQSVGYWATQGETAEAVAQGIWSDLSAWCGEESHHDDMTLLVLRVPKA